MKKIYVVRHAKSSWADLTIVDKERPLNSRGKRDAPVMAAWCKQHNYIPDFIITSTAKRAKATSKIFAKVLGVPADSYISDDQLYHAPAEQYMQSCYGLEESENSVMLFGHNPGITYLANEVSQKYTENVATCGILIIESSAPNWQELAMDNCNLISYKAPKLI